MSEQKPRTLYGKPLSEETLRFYPEKVSLETFGEILDAKDRFLKERKDFTSKKNLEEWVEDFAIWAGLEPREKIYMVWCHDPIGHDGRKLIQRIYKCEKSAISLCKKLNEAEVDGYVYSVVEQVISNPDYQ